MTSIDIDESSLLRADGKVVLITGGASGIGKAAAELFHSKGAKVVIGDLNRELGLETASAIGKQCTFQVCDVTSWSSLYALFDTTIRVYGKVDIVVVNAGVPEIEDFFANVVDDSNGRLVEPRYTVLDIDLKGVLATVKLAKYFIEKQNTPGAIVMTSSTAGFVGDTYIPVYVACKHGIVGLMRTLSGPGPFTDSGIRVNCVAPFMTETGFITDEMRTQLEAAGLPINKASSVAKAIAYLALTEDIQGQTIYVADDAFTEVEGPLRRLRPQWLGERSASLLEPKLSSDMMSGSHLKRSHAAGGD